jgi:hypothetical protein
VKILLLVPAFLFFGCCVNERPLVAKSIEPLTNVILPEYEGYVNADPKLNEGEAGISSELKAQRKRTKDARLKSAADLRAQIENLKK